MTLEFILESHYKKLPIKFVIESYNLTLFLSFILNFNSKFILKPYTCTLSLQVIIDDCHQNLNLIIILKYFSYP